MKSRVCIIICWAIALCALSPAEGEILKEEEGDFYGTTAKERVGLSGFGFLKISQGARPVGMGDAFTAVANDINAAFRNPAGLTHVERVEYVFSYNRWLAESTVTSGAVAVHTPHGVVGFSYIGFAPPEMKETTILKPGGTGETVDAGDVAIGLLYAKKMTDKLSFGAHFRWIQETLHDQKIRSFDLSLGTYFYTGFRSTRLAMTLNNFGKDVTPVDLAFVMPMTFNIACAMEVYGQKGDPAYLTAATDFHYATDFGERVHMGGEFWLWNALALRAGYKFNYDTESYSLGSGIRWNYGEGRQVSIDFAYSDLGIFDPPMRVSLSGSF